MRGNLFVTQIVAGSVLLIVLVGLVIGELWTTPRDSSKPLLQQLDRYGTAPTFSLTERSGKSVATDDLRGKVWIADFIYTRCEDTCPLQSSVMASLQTEFQADPDLQLVSITVDPLTDSPEVLSRYANQHGAHPSRWVFLTGEPKEIKRIAQEGFRLSAVPVTSESQTPVVFHSSRFILIDQNGDIRGYYDSGDPEAVKRLRETAKALLTRKGV
jgi:protein SCO1/2